MAPPRVPSTEVQGGLMNPNLSIEGTREELGIVYHVGGFNEMVVDNSEKRTPGKMSGVVLRKNQLEEFSEDGYIAHHDVSLRVLGQTAGSSLQDSICR